MTVRFAPVRGRSPASVRTDDRALRRDRVLRASPVPSADLVTVPPLLAVEARPAVESVAPEAPAQCHRPPHPKEW